MFIVESQSSRAARKMSYLMAIVLLLAPGALLTMHFYIRPRPPSHRAGAYLVSRAAARRRQLAAWLLSA